MSVLSPQSQLERCPERCQAVSWMKMLKSQSKTAATCLAVSSALTSPPPRVTVMWISMLCECDMTCLWKMSICYVGLEMQTYQWFAEMFKTQHSILASALARFEIPHGPKLLLPGSELQFTAQNISTYLRCKELITRLTIQNQRWTVSTRPSMDRSKRAQ